MTFLGTPRKPGPLGTGFGCGPKTPTERLHPRGSGEIGKRARFGTGWRPLQRTSPVSVRIRPTAFFTCITLETTCESER